MCTLFVTDGAWDDLDLLDGEEDLRTLEAILEQMQDNPAILRNLHKDRYTYHGCCPVIESQKVSSFWKIGYNIYRIKILFGEYARNHRIMCGFDGAKDEFFILAVTDREHAYEHDHAETRLLLDRYDEAGIKRFN